MSAIRNPYLLRALARLGLPAPAPNAVRDLSPDEAEIARRNRSRYLTQSLRTRDGVVAPLPKFSFASPSSITPVNSKAGGLATPHATEKQA